jgi:hypothetical protein
MEVEMPVKKSLERLPGFSQGVRSTAALRDVTVGQPICPNSQIRGRMVNGNYEPPEIGPGMENCQLDGAGWWERCEERGHDPYFRTTRIYTTVDIEEVNEETGEVFVTGTKRKVREVRTVNATQVSPNIMHNSGQGLSRKIRLRGYKRLEDLGFQEVCQYRACQKVPILRAAGLGDYCGEEHLNLVAAREEGEYLTRTDVFGLNAGYEQQAERKRQKQLRETMPRNVEKIA